MAWLRSEQDGFHSMRPSCFVLLEKAEKGWKYVRYEDCLSSTLKAPSGFYQLALRSKTVLKARQWHPINRSMLEGMAARRRNRSLLFCRLESLWQRSVWSARERTRHTEESGSDPGENGPPKFGTLTLGREGVSAEVVNEWMSAWLSKTPIQCTGRFWVPLAEGTRTACMRPLAELSPFDTLPSWIALLQGQT